MYSLTFCHFVRAGGGFLRTVFFFLIASVEAVSPPSPPSPHLPPSLKISLALQTLNVYPIKLIT